MAVSSQRFERKSLLVCLVATTEEDLLAFKLSQSFIVSDALDCTPLFVVPPHSRSLSPETF